MIEYVVWGTKTGDAFDEVVITTATPEECKQGKLARALQWAHEQGYQTRLSKMDLSAKPDFIGAINKGG